MDIIFDQLTNQNYPFSVAQRVSRALSVALTLVGGKSYSIRLEKGSTPPHLPLSVDTGYIVFQSKASPHQDMAFFELTRWKNEQKEELCVSFTQVEKWEMCGPANSCTGVFTSRAKTATAHPTKSCTLSLHSGPLATWAHIAAQKDAALADRAAIAEATAKLQEYIIQRVLEPLGVKTTPTAHKPNRNCEPGAEETMLVRPPTVSQVEG